MVILRVLIGSITLFSFSVAVALYKKKSNKEYFIMVGLGSIFLSLVSWI